ncbi:hypothetical protein RRG08_052217 [Elysia crispata]|uniref:Uncharacterized protein n=1 Tax=Elysia crispata TaxID=231223 RepID=A0AAE1B2E4_9GAST|nr:hypothetical protein RRG08_052217 [Elysia crispata]
MPRRRYPTGILPKISLSRTGHEDDHKTSHTVTGGQDKTLKPLNRVTGSNWVPSRTPLSYGHSVMDYTLAFRLIGINTAQEPLHRVQN